MNAKQFWTLLNKGNSLQKEDFQALIKLHENFPYFLIPKVLAAKYEMERTGGESRELLHWAAVQSPDRAWLKQLIEQNIGFLHPSPEDEIAGNQVPDDNPENSGSPGELKENSSEASDPNSTYNRTEILKKLEENLNKFKTASKNPEEKSPEPPGEAPAKRPEGEDLIESIKNKEEKEILDTRKIEQNDIIEAFREKSIRLKPVGENPDNEDLADLSQESTLFNDRLVSESFAKLLTKQNKKSKAIEIYRKLMLKFPNKSAYFAALIKELEE